MDFFEIAIKHLATTDPVMATCARERLNHHDPPQTPVASAADAYELDLCKMIVYQQISTKAADAIWRRIEPALLNQRGDEQALRDNGLSRQKAHYIAGITAQNRDLTHLTSLSDAEVIDELTAYKGIGRWSAEMFLMFSLARPDIFSVGDLGLRLAVSKLYKVDATNQSEIEAIATHWSPHRTAASLCLWHMLDERPLVL